MRRFTIQDLARPNQQYESRVGDDFQPLVVRAPNLPAVPDLMKIADATSRFMDRKEAHEEQEMQAEMTRLFQEQGGKTDTIRDRLLQAGEGKEGDDVEKAWIQETRKMVEEGLMPFNASIPSLRHLSKLEARRVQGNMNAQLAEESVRLSRITDENGDRVSREDALARFDEIYAEYMDNPLFDQSSTALRVMVNDADMMRERFANDVYELTSQAERIRGDELITQEFTDSMSVFENADLGTLGAGLRAAAVVNAGDRLREHINELGTPNAAELYVSAAFSRARTLVNGGFADQATRLLASVAEIEITPGLRLADDTRFEEDFSIAFNDATVKAEQQEDRLVQRRREFRRDVQDGFSPYYFSALTEKGSDPDTAFERARANYMASDDYAELKAYAEYDEDPDFIDGLFIEKQQIIDRGARAANAGESADALADYQLKELNGVPRSVLEDAVSADPTLTPQDKLKFLDDPSAEKWAEWRDHPESAILDRYIAAKTDIEGISSSKSEEIAEATADFQRRIHSAVTADDADFTQVRLSQAWKEAQAEFEAAVDSIAGEVRSAQEAITEAYATGDNAGIQRALANSQGVLTSGYRKAEMDRARTREINEYREALNGPEADAARRKVERAIATVNKINEIEEGSLAEAVVEERWTGELTRRMTARDAEIRLMSPEDARQARANFHDEIASELAAEILPEEEQAKRKVLSEATVKEIQQFERSRSALDTLADGEPWSNAYTSGLIITDAMDSPDSTTPLLEFITKPATRARRASAEVGREFLNVALTQDYEKAEEDLIRQYLANGAVTARQASLSGFKPKVKLEIDGPIHVSEETAEFYRSKGWEVTPGRPAVDRGDSPVRSRFVKVVEAKPDPYLTLYFLGDTREGGNAKLTRWLRDTPDDVREAFHRSTGRPFTTLEEADRLLERHQRVLLDRLTK